MKIKIDKAPFLKVLAAVSSIVEVNSAMPIVENILIVARNNEVILKATNLMIGVIYTMTDIVEVISPGSLLVPAGRLVKLLKETPDASIVLTSEEFNCDIEVIGGSFKLLGEAPEKMPEVGEFTKEKYKIEMSTKVFSDMVSKTSFATTLEKNRYDMSNLLIHLKGSNLKLVATDGKRLAISSQEIDLINIVPADDDDSNKSINDKSINDKYIEDKIAVPAKSLVMIAKVLVNEEKFKLGYDDKTLFLKTERLCLVARLSDANFPPYERIMVQNLNYKAEINTKSFMNVLKRVAMMTSDKSMIVDLSFEAENLTVSAKSDIGDAKLDMDIKFDGDPFAVKLNPKFIVEAVRIVENESFTLRLQDKVSAVCLNDNDFSYLVLPIKE